MQAFTTLEWKCFKKYFWEKSHRQACMLGLTMVALSRTYTRPPAATPVGISSGNLSLQSLTTPWFQSPAQGLRTKTPLSGASFWGGQNTQVPKPTAVASATSTLTLLSFHPLQDNSHLWFSQTWRRSCGWHFWASQADPVPPEEHCLQQSPSRSHLPPEADLWVHHQVVLKEEEKCQVASI